MDVAVALGVAALIAAFLVPGMVEWLKRPHLEIVPSPWAPSGPVAWTFAAVRVRNKPLPRRLRWLLAREAAQSCTVWLDFYEWGTDRRVTLTIPGRWSSHPEPIRALPSTAPQGAISITAGTAGTPNIQQPSFFLTFDPSLVRHELDVAVGVGEEVAVAVLRDGDAFAFTASSYAHPGWGQPDLKLQRGATYRVVVRVQGSSVECQQAFKLEYLTTDFSAFELVVAK